MSEGGEAPLRVPGALPRHQHVAADAQLRAVRTVALVRELTDRFEDPAKLGNFDVELLLAQRLHDRLGAALDVHVNRFAPKYVAGVFERLYASARDILPPLAGCRVVEVGCGSLAPLNLGMVFLLMGARQFTGIDLDPPQDVPRAVRALADVVRWMLVEPARIVAPCIASLPDMLASVASFDLAGLAAGNAEAIDHDRLRYRQESVTAMRSLGDGEVDLLLSNSFLEHVEDIDGAMREMRRVVRIGGFLSHGIDATDHRRYGNPAIGELTFLREPGGESFVHGTNRIRPLSFVPRFERHGFECVRIRPFRRSPVTDAEVRGFCEPFRSMRREDLELTMVHLLLRRVS